LLVFLLGSENRPDCLLFLGKNYKVRSSRTNEGREAEGGGRLLLSLLRRRSLEDGFVAFQQAWLFTSVNFDLGRVLELLLREVIVVDEAGVLLPEKPLK